MTVCPDWKKVTAKAAADGRYIRDGKFYWLRVCGEAFYERHPELAHKLTPKEIEGLDAVEADAIRLGAKPRPDGCYLIRLRIRNHAAVGAWTGGPLPRILVGKVV